MTRWFRDLSVRWKVIALVMLVTAPVLGVATVVVVVADVISTRNALVERVGALARVAGINSAAALAFQDAEAAEEVLAALGSEEDIIGIEIRLMDGTPFARYLSDRPQHRERVFRVESDERAERVREPGGRAEGKEASLRFRDGYLDFEMVVRVNDKILGYMDLQYDTSALGRRAFTQAALAVVVFGGGLGLALMLAARLHRVISGPVGAVAEAMEDTASKQDFSIRLEVDQKDEIGTLMRAFNTMLEQIQVRDVELRKARDAAEAGSHAKSQFLVSMSHEIRTPMNGILGMTELLQGTALDKRQRHFTRTIQLSAESLLAIINDILDFSKIEAGRLELEHLDFDLGEIVERTSDLLVESANAKGLRFLTDLPAGLPLLARGDPGRLQQVLTNLISNAIKFTADGSIEVRVRVVDETGTTALIRIDILDTGIGLSSEEQERVFERFSQADSSTSRRYGGTGLGLSISRQLVELMGGIITLRSAPGCGSAFSIQLCFAKRAPAAVVPPEALAGLKVLVIARESAVRAELIGLMEGWGIDVSCECELSDGLALALTCATSGSLFRVLVVEQGLFPELDAPTGRVLRELIARASGLLVLAAGRSRAGLDYAWGRARIVDESAGADNLRRCLGDIIAGRESQIVARDQDSRQASSASLPRLELRVLVAEDNEVNQEVIDSMLRALRCDVILCEDGQAALSALRSEAPDVILMDCQMPVMDGYETARQIRAGEKASGRHIPIVALTAHAMLGDRDRALGAGMDDYLSKPFKLAELCDMLQRWTRRPADGARCEIGEG